MEFTLLNALLSLMQKSWRGVEEGVEGGVNGGRGGTTAVY